MRRLIVAVAILGAALAYGLGEKETATTKEDITHSGGTMVSSLGAFSVSLTVKDIAASRAFYEKLGFQKVMGDEKQNWLILRNGNTTIGLFHGLFERNIMTFNPGWTAQAKPLTEFRDVREIQRELKAKGLTLASEADEATTGPGSLMVMDPDGNPILIDQHVESPRKIER